MKSALFGLIGLVVGWLLASSSGISKVGSDAATGAIESMEAAANPTQLERIHELEQQLVIKDAELTSTRAEFDDYRRTATTRNQAAVDEEVTIEAHSSNPFMANVQAIAIESSQARRREEIEKLKWSLNLTSDQITALESFYQEESAMEASIMEQMFSGKSMEDIQKEAEGSAVDRKYHTVSQLLKAILTPEQQETYESNKEQEALERKEANAYRDLSMMQSQFLLDDDQKDAVFAIFYEKTYAVKPKDWAAYEIDSQDPESFIKSKAIENERLLQELSEVLSPEQVEIYRRKIDNEAEMIRRSMEMFGPKLNAN
ncbi:MAG: hypothetical protein EA353_03075 [Puniceicoccaceae bacterium]|nr:MAG: hypothetical protein EA353_03075 [Puniceicoccaceae bacterium]